MTSRFAPVNVLGDLVRSQNEHGIKKPQNPVHMYIPKYITGSSSSSSEVQIVQVDTAEKLVLSPSHII